MLRSDGPTAELCFSLTKPIDVRDRNEVAASLLVKAGGKIQKITANDISLTSSDVCLQNLEHRLAYDVTLQRIKDLEGKRLPRKYHSAFTVPDRKPVLTFVGDNRRAILPRHVRPDSRTTTDQDLTRTGMAHVVRSVNVAATRLTLYKIADKKLFSGAWQQNKQMNLSPSESLYFSKQNGKVVFESDLVFGDSPNKDQTLVAPLPIEKDLAPGLYYLAATPTGEAEKNPGLFAGQWFLVSDLRLSAVRLDGGVQVFASYGTTQLNPQTGVSVAALGQDGKPLAEATTGADGTAYLKLSQEDMDRLFLVTGEMGSGDVDLFDLGGERSITGKGALLHAEIETDKDVYRSGSTAIISVRAMNLKGELQDVGESSIKLITPDQKLYKQQRIASGKTGYIFETLSLPQSGVSGAWDIVWVKRDGSHLARKSIQLSPAGQDGKLNVTLGQESIALEETTNLSVKATDQQGRPLMYQNGVINIYPARPDIRGWSGYRFGDGVADREPLLVLPFLTGEDGAAQVALSFSNENKPGFDGIEGLRFEAKLEDGVRSVPFTLPVRRQGDLLIGIRPLSDERAFPENSMARFDVVALDLTGRRRAQNGLYYLVYEEGRSFDWVPSEGHWDYRQNPYHRRVGGGRLSLAASGENIVNWPVTAGHYILQITNVSGRVLSRYEFDAGRRDEPSVRTDEAKLRFVDLPESMDVTANNKIKIHLSDSAMVSAVISDGARHKTIHRFLKAGDQEIEVPVEEGWGHKTIIRIEALPVRSFEPVMAQSEIAVRNPLRNLVLKAGLAPNVMTGEELVVPFQTQKLAKGQQTFLSAVAYPTVEDGSTLPPILVDRVPVALDGKADLRLRLPTYDGSLRLVAKIWNTLQSGVYEGTVKVNAPVSISASVPERLRTGDKTALRIVVQNNKKNAIYRYTISGPSGLNLSGPTDGSLALKKRQPQTILLSVSARSAFEGAIRLELSSPNAPAIVQEWPVYAFAEQTGETKSFVTEIKPNQVLPLSMDKDQLEHPVFVLPVPSANLLPWLHRLVRSEPRTTRELAQWIETIDGMSLVLQQTGLMGEKVRVKLQAQRLVDLLRRQNVDGSFSVLKAGGSGDLVSTAAALKVLATLDKEAASLGADWLNTRLQNTWFDETERNARAFAFEALASMKRADISGVRYFAETSRDKALSVDALAAVGSALLQAGDEEAALQWIKKAQESLTARTEREDSSYWRAVHYLAKSGKASFQDLFAYVADPKDAPLEIDTMRSLEVLAAMNQTIDRAGSWRMSVAGKEDKKFGIVVLPADVASQAGAVELRNMSPISLYVIQTTNSKDKAREEKGARPAVLAVKRSLYSSEGTLVNEGDILQTGRVYFMKIEAPASKGDLPELLVSLSESLSFESFIPLGGRAAAMKAAYPWTASNLASIREISAGLYGTAFILDSSKGWETLIAIMPRFKGEFALPTLSARTEDRIVPLSQNALRFVVQ